MSTAELRKDWYIAMGVLSQPIWLLMQHCFLCLFQIDDVSATQYRIIMVAIPLLVAIVAALRRRPMLFFVVYSIVLSILLLTIALYPENAEYVRSQGLRFLLPIVVPSALCLVSVKDFEVVRRSLILISWICAFLGIILGITYFVGIWRVQGYNMSLSYGLLFPMVFLFSQRRVINYFISFFLLLFVLAVGSRGAVFCFIIYVLFDLISRRSWLSIIMLISSIVLYLNLSSIDVWFQDLGISSRTMNLYNDESITTDTGRSEIQSYFIAQLMQHPFTGIGLFGDRTVPGISYCHNLFLEILLDFGFLLGGAIIIWFIILVVKEYLKCGKTDKMMVIMCICVLILPLMFSGSYLIDYSIGLFVGILALLQKHNRVIKLYYS